MFQKLLYKFFKYAVLNFSFLIFYVYPTFANSTKYICSQNIQNLYVIFDQTEKKVVTGRGNPNKYWTEGNYIFWVSADDVTVYEYTFENSYNKLSGKLKIKSHNLVTSQNNWLDYKCAVNQ